MKAAYTQTAGDDYCQGLHDQGFGVLVNEVGCMIQGNVLDSVYMG